MLFVCSVSWLFLLGSVASEPVEKWDGSTASASPPLPSPPFPCREAAPLNPARGSGGAL